MLKSRKYSPFFVFLITWLVVSFLYILSVSDRLYYGIDKVAYVFFFVILFFGLGSVLAIISVRYKKQFALFETDRINLQKRFWLLYLFLIILSSAEFLVFGAIPFVEKLRGANISHFAFGVPSLHGLVIAGHLFFSLLSVILFYRFKKKRLLMPVIIMLIYGVLIVSRKLFMVGVVQLLIVYLILYRTTLKKITGLALIGFLLISLFGYVGNVRTGNSIIEEYGGVDRSTMYEYFPAAAWVYLYMTTPMHNYIYAVENTEPEGNFLFKNTLAPILPSVLENAIFKTKSQAERFTTAGEKRYWLESKVFNVSTALIDPYIDLGEAGVALFLVLVGWLSTAIYRTYTSAIGLIVSVMLTMAGILSIYSNNYVNLNFIGQLIWALLYFYVLNIHRFTIVKIR